MNFFKAWVNDFSDKQISSHVPRWCMHQWLFSIGNLVVIVKFVLTIEMVFQ